MFDQVQLQYIIVLCAALLMIGLGIFVWFHKRNSATNILFLVLCVNQAWWTVINYFAFQVNPGNALLFVQLTIVAALPNSIWFLLFIKNFPKDELQIKRRNLLLIILCLIAAANLIFTKFGLTQIAFNNGLPTIPDFNIGMGVFVAIVMFGFGYGTFLMIKKYITTTDAFLKRQWLYIIVAFFIMFVLIIIFNVLFTVVLKDSRFIPYSPTFVLPFVMITGYAIVRHGLLNIRLVAAEFVTILIIVAALIQGLASQNVIAMVLQFIFVIFMLFLGLSLVKSVNREIKQKEEIELIARKLEKANIRLKEIDKTKTEFLSIASHQLRTPLSVIKGYISLIQEGAYGKVDPKVDVVLKNAYESNEHLIHLVDDFLSISRIEQGRTKYDFEKINLIELINSVVTELKMRAKEQKLRLNFENNIKSAELVGDSEKVHHVIYNFVDNAIKYCQKGSIKVLLESEDNGWTVRVIDTGIGFGEIDGANFFQKFYRGNNVQGIHVNGTGLGLYVCRRFIEAHSGKIWAKSKGELLGSEFGFWLPLTQKEQVDTSV